MLGFFLSRMYLHQTVLYVRERTDDLGPRASNSFWVRHMKGFQGEINCKTVIKDIDKFEKFSPRRLSYTETILSKLSRKHK